MEETERLSVTTAMVGLLVIGGKMIDVLWDLDLAPTAESAFINKLLQSVKQCRSSLHVMYKTLSSMESTELPFPERGSWIQIDGLIAILTDSVLAFSELQGMVEDIDEQPSPINYDAVQRQHGAQMNTLSARIRWLNLSITMMMTVMKCPGDKDAQSSRDGLDHRVMRLLASNSALSGRMRGLQDAFDDAGIQAPEVRNYSEHHAGSHPSPLSSDTSSDGGSSNHNRVWSVYTGYTLSDIPVLSIIALPVTTDEIRDGDAFYTFEFAREVNNDLGLLMHCQTGPEAYKNKMSIKTKPAAPKSKTKSERSSISEKKKWAGLASAVKVLGRKKRRKAVSIAEAQG